MFFNDPTNLIYLLALVPLVGAGMILVLPHGRDNLVRFTAMAGSLAVLAISLILAYEFPWSETDGSMRFVETAAWFPGLGLTIGVGVDAISIWLILLTTFLMPLVVLGSFTAVKNRVKEFFFWLLLLEAAMLGVFIATDLIFFYICFEFTLVPLYFLIGVFGSTQRLVAARVFFLYTFTGSMLTFAGVLYVAYFNTTLPAGLYAGAGQWTFAIATLTDAARHMSFQQQSWVLLALLAGFAVKVPLFPLHTWLPLAHTEAPTAGSVVLAGVLLKLGTYGLLRLAIPMTPEATAVFAPYIASLAIVGILYTALICWVQKDIKKLIAYSSVSHLGFCVLGMFALNAQGLAGSVMYMINHGLSTGALFLCVGMIYERFHTRQMKDMGGLAKAMPIWACFMVFFVLASVGLPGLNGFVGEFLTLLGAFTATTLLGPWFAAVAGLGMIFGAIYLLYMVGRVVWGPLKIPAGDHEHGHADHAHAIRDLSLREIAVLIPLALACLWLGLYPKPVLSSIESPLRLLVAPSVDITPAATSGAARHKVLTLQTPATPPAPNSGAMGQARSN